MRAARCTAEDDKNRRCVYDEGHPEQWRHWYAAVRDGADA